MTRGKIPRGVRGQLFSFQIIFRNAEFSFWFRLSIMVKLNTKYWQDEYDAKPSKITLVDQEKKNGKELSNVWNVMKHFAHHPAAEELPQVHKCRRNWRLGRATLPYFGRWTRMNSISYLGCGGELEASREPVHRLSEFFRFLDSFLWLGGGIWIQKLWLALSYSIIGESDSLRHVFYHDW